MTIHIGLIGGGNISETHARAARAIAGVEIAAIYRDQREEGRGALPGARWQGVSRLRRIPGASPDGHGRDRQSVRTACGPGHCRGTTRPSCADREADRHQHRTGGCAYRGGGALRRETWRHVSGPRETRNPGTPRVDHHRSDRQASGGGCASEMVSSSGILQRLAMAWDVSRWTAGARSSTRRCIPSICCCGCWAMWCECRRARQRCFTRLRRKIPRSRFSNLRAARWGLCEATTAAYPGYPRRVEITGTEGTVILEQDRILTAELAKPATRLQRRHRARRKPERVIGSGQ